jgi:hypothetical protein
MSVPFGGLMSQTRASKMEYLVKKRICTRKHCRTVFTEDTNIGSWECEWYHPAFYLPRGKSNEYACCWRAADSEGCVRADHIDTTVEAKGRREVTQDPSKTFDRVLRQIEDCQIILKDDDMVLFENKFSRKINPLAWKSSKDGSEHTVTRLDFQERRRRMSSVLKLPVTSYTELRFQPY